MEITAAWAANLKALNHGLDDPGDAMTATLQQLALDARLGVHSYLGCPSSSIPGRSARCSPRLTSQRHV